MRNADAYIVNSVVGVWNVNNVVGVRICDVPYGYQYIKYRDSSFRIERHTDRIIRYDYSDKNMLKSMRMIKNGKITDTVVRFHINMTPEIWLDIFDAAGYIHFVRMPYTGNINDLYWKLTRKKRT